MKIPDQIRYGYPKIQQKGARKFISIVNSAEVNEALSLINSSTYIYWHKSMLVKSYQHIYGDSWIFR